MEEIRPPGFALAASGGPLLVRIQRVLGRGRGGSRGVRGTAIAGVGTAALAAVLLCCATWREARSLLPDRAAFAAVMAKVETGMSKAEVLRLLGEPDDVVTAGDKIIHTARTKEILG